MSEREPLLIYIAGSWESKDRLREMVHRVHDVPGMHVTSKWLTNQDDPVGVLEGEEANQDRALACAKMDLEGVEDCDLFILDTFDNTGRGGKDFEMGVAHTLAREIWVVGPRINIFQRLADCHFLGWDAVIEKLKVYDDV